MNTAIIIARGNGWKEALKRCPEDGERFIVNKLGLTVEGKHWVTAHHEILIPNTTKIKHSDYEYGKEVDVIWPFKTGGTSSLLALDITRRMGFEKVILCGVNLDNEYCKWPIVRHWIEYIEKYPEFCSNVRSLTGLTKHLFGEYNG